MEKTARAAKSYQVTEVLIAGGVSANQHLRQTMRQVTDLPVRYPPLNLCTDNGAMIAAAAYYRYRQAIDAGTIESDLGMIGRNFSIGEINRMRPSASNRKSAKLKGEWSCQPGCRFVYKVMPVMFDSYAILLNSIFRNIEFFHHIPEL